eukprot:tig00000190_g13864.t1
MSRGTRRSYDRAHHHDSHPSDHVARLRAPTGALCTVSSPRQVREQSNMSDQHMEFPDGAALLPANLEFTMGTSSTMSLGALERAEALGFGLQRGPSVGLTGISRADSIKFFENDQFQGPLDHLSEDNLVAASALFASAQSVGLSKDFRPDLADLTKLVEMDVQPISPETTVGDSPVTNMLEDDGNGAAAAASSSSAAASSMNSMKATQSAEKARYVIPIVQPAGSNSRTTPVSPTLAAASQAAAPHRASSRSPVPAVLASSTREKRAAAQHAVQVSDDSDEEQTGEPLRGQSTDIIDSNNHFLRIVATLSAQNIGSKGGIATIAAGRQGQQLKCKVSLEATAGTVLQEDVDLEAMLLGPDKKPLDMICLDDDMVPALQQWQKAYTRNANKDHRPTVTVPKSQPAGWSKTIALRVLVLSSQLSNAPVRLCLRPTDSRFSQLQVLLPQMYCMSVPRTKRDRDRSRRPPRAAAPAEAPAPAPSPAPEDERPRNRRRTGTPAQPSPDSRSTVYQPAEIALVKPAIGPAKPYRPEILVRLRGVGAQPFRLFLVQRSNQRVAEAESVGEVRMADDLHAECRFRLPQLESYNYVLEADYGGGKTIVRGGIGSGPGRYGACTVSIARPSNGERIVGLHVGFVFSAQPFSCFENRGFRLYLSDGRVIDTDQNLDGVRGAVHFAEHGDHIAVCEVVDEACGAAQFEVADRLLVSPASADREPPRLKTYYPTGTDGEYLVELTDGRRFTTTADIRGFKTLEPVRPAAAPASYPQPQTRTYGITSQRVQFRLVDEAETREQQAAAEKLRRFMEVLQSSGADPMNLLNALAGGSANTTPSLPGSGGSSSSVGAPYSECAARLAAFSASPACRLAAAKLRAVADGARAAGPDAARALAAARDASGNSPLHYAAGLGAGDLCSALLDASAADPYAANQHGLTAMHIAALLKSASALDAFYDRRVDLTVRAAVAVAAAAAPAPCWAGRTVQECWPEYYDEGRANAVMRPVIYVPPLMESDDERTAASEEDEEDGVRASPMSSDAEEQQEEGAAAGEGMDVDAEGGVPASALSGPYASLVGMPDELVLESLQSFDSAELSRFGAVCRRFRRLAKAAAARDYTAILPDEVMIGRRAPFACASFASVSDADAPPNGCVYDDAPSVRIFSQTGLTTFELGPLRLVSRRFNSLIVKDDGTAVMGMTAARVAAAAGEYFRLYREPVMLGDRVDAAAALAFLHRELFARRVWQSAEHAAQGRAWSSFAAHVAALAKARVLAHVSADVAAGRRSAAEAEDEAGKAAGREELVLQRTPGMAASVEATWARVAAGREQVAWADVSRAAYRLFAPLPVSDRDLDNARAIVQERLANPALLPRNAAPVNLGEPINKEAFVKTWPWFFFARGTLARTQNLWREAAEAGAAGAGAPEEEHPAPAALRHAFVSRHDAEQELVRSGRAGTYMLRLSSILWPDPDTGALAVSVLSRDPSAPPVPPPAAPEPALVQHELLPPRDYDTGEAVVRHLAEIPQVFREALHVQQEMASYIRFDHQYIIPDYRRRPHAASTSDFASAAAAAAQEEVHVKPSRLVGSAASAPASSAVLPGIERLSLSEAAAAAHGQASLIGQMERPAKAQAPAPAEASYFRGRSPRH